MQKKFELAEKINNIIYKYNLDKYYVGFRKKIEAEKLINKLCCQYIGKKVFILYNHPYEVQYFKDVDEFSFDESNVANKKNIDNLKFEEYDVVINISYFEHKLIREKINISDDKYLWLYEYFEDNGLICCDEFYNIECNRQDQYRNEEFKFEKKQFSPCVELALLKQDLIEATDSSKKCFLLKKIIFICLYIRDFLGYMKYINILFKYNDIDLGDYYNSYMEINEFIEDVREKIGKAVNEHIVLYWMDAVSYSDSKDMPYLSSQMERGVNFHNAYTVTPYTNQTLFTILCKKKIVDDKGYELNHINDDNSVVLKMLSKNGYSFKLASGYFRKSIFQRDCYFEQKYSRMTTNSEILFDMCENILNETNKTVYFLHLYSATHSPFFSSEISKDSFDKPSKAFKEGKCALDRQLEFYDKIIPSNVTRIYFSDHGQPVLYRDWLHTVFSVVGENIQKESIDTLFSYIDFDLIIKALVEKKSVYSLLPYREYAHIQQLPLYFDLLIMNSLHKKRLRMDYLGWNGLINEREMYLEYNNGKKLYVSSECCKCVAYDFELEDEIISNDSSGEHINKLHDMVKGYIPIDIQCDKFKYSQYIYKFFDNIKKRKQIVYDYINSMFDSIAPCETVAIRTGGVNTKKLLSILSESNRRKVRYIIDTKADEETYLEGVKMISVKQMEQYKINCIVLSSFLFLSELRDESLKYPKEYKVIDYYKDLMEKKLIGNEEFWVCSQLEEDYEVGFPFEDFEY